MIIEIYQVGKVPPLTRVECDSWTASYDNGMPRLKLMKDKTIVAMFFFSNIAGFKEVDGETDGKPEQNH